MKLTKHLFGIALTAIASSAFVACTNELSDRMETSSDALKLLRAPEVYAWSGEQTLNATRSDVYTVPSVGTYSSSIATRDDQGSDAVISWQPSTRTFDDKADVLAYVGTIVDEGKQYDPDIVDDSFLFSADGEFMSGEDFTFHMYAVVSQTGQTHFWGIYYYDTEGDIHYQKIWDDVPRWGAAWNENICQGVEVTIKAGYKFGFYWDAIGVYVYQSSWGGIGTEWNNKFDFHTSSSLNSETYDENTFNEWNKDQSQPVSNFTPRKIRAVTFYDEKKEHTYLGIEDGVDFDYQDIVFYCPEKLNTVKEENTKPGVTDEEFDGNEPTNKCPKCPHEKHEGTNCPDPNCPSKDCNPCPEKHEGKCEHPGSSHDTDGYCDECDDEDGVCQHPKCDVCGHPEHEGENCKDPQCPEFECNPCPNVENGVGCTHSKADHHYDRNKNQWVCDDEDCDAEDCHPAEGTVTPPAQTAPDDIIHHKNEVEVNFELVDSHKDKNDKDIKDLASKLSIHVRHATDVEIKIPVPTRYVIQQDDLYIFNEHYAPGEGFKGNYHGTYGGTIVDGDQVLNYEIAGQNVELHVQYVTAYETEDTTDPFRFGYIKVWTKGINQKVIDWCVKHNGDGVNFEVWTYFGVTENEALEISRGDLETYLNQSTIEFKKYFADQSDPDYYINAFGYDYYDNTWGQQHYDYINPDDCYVKPVDPDTTYLPRTNYKEREEMIENTVDEWDEHLNSTPYNYIWVKDGVTADEYHGGLN